QVMTLSLNDEWREMRHHAQNKNLLRCCSSEFHKLLRIVQGIPPLADHTQLELSVVYNACLCSVACAQFSEAELLLKKATERVLQMTGDDPLDSDPLLFWRTIIKSVENTAMKSSVQYIFGLQWAIWLADCKLTTIQECQHELFTLCETLSAGVDQRRQARGKSCDVPRLVMDPGRLLKLLQICTLITQGAERLSEGRSSEALSGLQTASSLPAPTTLVAYTHLISGSCLALMNCPQMALQCYRKVLETDPRCVCALYQSILVYRKLGNTQAEIQALRLLHSTLMLPSATEPSLPGTPLLCPSSLLQSQSLNSLLSVPSALSVLHSLAQKCVLHGRLSEGVEYYLDLLATVHSEDQHGVHVEVPALPRLPELYLEAGAALLMDQRPADCMVLCEEVISSTLELLPERLVLEEPEDTYETEAGAVGAGGDQRVGMLFWAGAAYLLQGHCYTQLKDWKQAVAHYTGCINLLVKVRFKKKGKTCSFLALHSQLKGLSLAGRGISFTQTEQLREALRDLQLSLQASPDCVAAGLWCGEVLWRLGRRQEAAACWENTWSCNTQSSESLSLYLQEPQSGPLLDSMELRHRIKELSPPCQRRKLQKQNTPSLNNKDNDIWHL
uniref:Uncharacterized protein n=1 Tax=Mola mola TaxID=94237 RepID=A0A3Q3X6J6_MOLML